MADNSWMDPHGFNENSRLRASDADRDRAASVINNALAEGRLSAEEHSERLDAIYSAKTHAEIVPLLDDLPERYSPADPAVPSATQPASARRRGRIICFLSGSTRKGGWHPEPVIDIVTVLGGAELDFREAVLPGKEITVHATSILGGVEITVPPDMHVIDNGVAILGGREISGGEEAVGPDSPVLRIEGFCLLGGIEVKRRNRKGDRRPRAGDSAQGQLEDVLGQIRERRHDVRSQIRAQRHEIRGEIRDRRHEFRHGWSGDDQ
jgi:hypothetical protein